MKEKIRFLSATPEKKPRRNTTTIRILKTPRKKNIQLHLCDVYNVVGRSVVVFFFKKRKEKESSISFFLASTIIIIVFFFGDPSIQLHRKNKTIDLSCLFSFINVCALFLNNNNNKKKICKKYIHNIQLPPLIIIILFLIVIQCKNREEESNQKKKFLIIIISKTSM